MPLPAVVDADDLYPRHAPFVRAVVRRFLKQSSDVEDVVQDVFFQAWRQVARFDPGRGSVQSWLGAIARSRAIDRLRHYAVRSGTEPLADPDALPSTDSSPAYDAECAQARRRVRRQWSTLPEPIREILRLAYDEHLTQREIAAHLGCTLGIVKSRMLQGLRALRTDGAPGTAWDPDFSWSSSEWALTVSDDLPVARANAMFAHLQVMIVDDDAPTRAALAAVLERSGACPLTFGCVGDARSSLEVIWPDVLVADLTMPGEDGYVLLEYVRQVESQRGLSLPAIAFTARGAEAERTRALLAGFRRHLSKPVHPIAFLNAIEEVVRGCDRPGEVKPRVVA